MDFLEHDLKTLQEDMLEPFLPSETKTLLQQLTSAVEYLHSNWIMHRDLKTSNLLMNNRGQIKVADFGMARYYGDPPPKLTQLVVTLWYRAPELLLGAETYGVEIDMWSVGCIFGELLTKEPLFQGKNEVDQLAKVIFPQPVPDNPPFPLSNQSTATRNADTKSHHPRFSLSHPPQHPKPGLVFPRSPMPALSASHPTKHTLPTQPPATSAPDFPSSQPQDAPFSHRSYH
jgi:cell division cycle 2-like protein